MSLFDKIKKEINASLKNVDPDNIIAFGKNTKNQKEEILRDGIISGAANIAYDTATDLSAKAVERHMENSNAKQQMPTQPGINPGTEEETFTFAKIPASFEEFKALPEADLHSPKGTAALTVLAFAVYSQNRDEAIKMLNYLRGPRPLSNMDIQFISDRLRGAEYLPQAFMAGAIPDNDYTYDVPIKITVSENLYSRANLSEGYLRVFIKSGGADSASPLTLRLKPSTQEWFLWEQYLLTKIRQPRSQNPWA